MIQGATASNHYLRAKRAAFGLAAIAIVLCSFHYPAFAQWKQATGFSNANAGNAESVDFVYGFHPWGDSLLATAGCAVDLLNFPGGTSDSLFLSTDHGETWNGFAPNGGEPFLLGGGDFLGSAEVNPPNNTSHVLSYSTDAGQTWSSDTAGWNITGGNGTASSIVQIGNTIFAANPAGVYHQSAPGAQWTVDTAGIGAVFQFFLPLVGSLISNGNDLILSTYLNGIYRSPDMGASWSTVNNGLPTYFWPSGGFALSGSSLYVMTTHDTSNLTYDIYRSTNNGDNWSLMNSAPLSWGEYNPEFIAYGNNLFAASDSGLYASFDNGATWTLEDQGLPMFMGSFNYVVAISGGNLVLNTPDSDVWYRPLSDFGISAVSPSPAPFGGLNLTLSENPSSASEESICYTLNNAGSAQVMLMDELGWSVRMLQNGRANIGQNVISLDPQSLAPGTYFVRVTAGGTSAMQKLVISR